jgi:hypothetical protein
LNFKKYDFPEVNISFWMSDAPVLGAVKEPFTDGMVYRV